MFNDKTATKFKKHRSCGVPSAHDIAELLKQVPVMAYRELAHFYRVS